MVCPPNYYIYRYCFREVRDLVKIAVIIIAFKRREYILRALRSIESETRHDHAPDIIVIKNYKDESIDNEILAKGAKCLFSTSLGLGEKVVEAIAHTEAEIIAFLEDDDVNIVGKIGRISEVFNSHDNLIFYHNSFSSVDKQLQSNDYYDGRFSETLVLSRESSIKDINTALKFGGAHNLSSMAVSKELIIENSAIVSQFTFGTDHAFFLLALDSDKSLFFDDFLGTLYSIGDGVSSPDEASSDYLENKVTFLKGVLSEFYTLDNVISTIQSRQILTEFIARAKLHLSLIEDIPQYRISFLELSKLFAKSIMTFSGVTFVMTIASLTLRIFGGVNGWMYMQGVRVISTLRNR